MGMLGSVPPVRLHEAAQVALGCVAMLDDLEGHGAVGAPLPGSIADAPVFAPPPARDEADRAVGAAPAEDAEEEPASFGAAVAAATHGRPEDTVWTPVLLAEDEAAFHDQRLLETLESAHPAMVVAPLTTGRIVAQVVAGGSLGVAEGRPGTFGGRVRGPAGDGFGVTAGHVVAGAVGAEVWQPASADGEGSVIGVVHAVTELRERGNLADLGLIVLHAPDGDVYELTLLGDERIAGRPVRKAGRTTGTTSGWVSRVGAQRVAVWIDGQRHRFDGLFAVETDDGAFSDFGDSGALVLDEEDGAVLGMVVAGSPAGGRAGGPLTWAVPARNLAGSMAALVQAGR